MEYIKGFINEYNEVIYKLITTVLLLCVGGMVGYILGVYNIISIVMK